MGAIAAASTDRTRTQEIAPPRHQSLGRALAATTIVAATAMSAAFPSSGPATPAAALAPPAGTVFISELHYDNTGTDTGEQVEIFGPAGTDLTGWSLVLYSGSGGAPYDTVALTGSLPDLGGGFGVVVVAPTTIQNGSPDGIALVDDVGSVVQFLSYEGTFTAVGGPAAGLGSTDVGVSEEGTTPVGHSLQLSGTGTTLGDLTWTGPQPNTFGAVAPIDTNGGPPPSLPDVFLSELHYDNDGVDTGEAIEVQGPAGTDLTGWTVVLYSGSGGGQYDTIALGGTIPDLDAGVGVVDVARAPVQNGSPDGLALVAPGDVVVEFLSYEGTFTATDGPAIGLVSTDIVVAESPDTPVGQSLQRIDDVWYGPAGASFGALNTPPPTVGVCPEPPVPTPIHVLQGGDAATPCEGEEVLVEAVVVADFEGPSPALSGFYLQEEDADVDADPLTSEGVFVFNGDADAVALGDLVRVRGTATEFADQTQIGALTDVSVLASGASQPSAATVTLPLAAADALEAVEGMRVVLPQTLYVTELFDLGRFGQVTVSSGDRLAQPTAVAEPGPAAVAVAGANDLNRLIVDDTTNDQNRDPIIYGGNGAPLTAANPLRGGDTLSGATGVMTYTGGGASASPEAFRLRPADAPIAFATAHPRPPSSPPVGGSLRVASFNVLNYFLSLDTGPTGCGPAGLQQCRGADTAAELTRQRDKLVAAIVALDADVVGLVELENTSGVDPLGDLVAAVNAVVGAGTYARVDTGTIGGDAIRVGLIYRTATVVPVGTPAILDATVDPDFDSSLNRPALAQAYQESATGETLTVVVNHLKSKSCGGATGDDADQGDGQSCYNATRTAAAAALATWLAGDPTGTTDPDVLIIGDLNAYAREDPIDALAAAGYVDLAAGADPDTYSYVFGGEWGSLDYALASPTLAPQATGAAAYHVNADEASVLDYNVEFKSAGQLTSLYAPDEFRTSDHDPIVAGFDLGRPEEADLAVTVTADPDPVAAGGDLEVVVEVANDGPVAATATEVVLTLPAGLTVTATTGCAEDPAGVPTCTLGNLADGDTTSFTVNLAVDPTLPPGTMLDVTAEAASAVTDPDPADDVGTASTEVITSADLSLTLTATGGSNGALVRSSLAGSAAGRPASTAVVGDTVTITSEIVNLGPSDAADVVLSQTYPAAITDLAIAEDGPYTCSLAGQVLTCTIAAHPAGVTATIAVTGAVAAPGELAIGVELTSSTPDPDPTNDVSGDLTITVTSETTPTVTPTAPTTPTTPTATTTPTAAPSSTTSPTTAPAITPPSTSPTDPTSPPSGLPRTGAAGAGATLVVALGVFLAGAAFVCLARRRLPGV